MNKNYMTFPMKYMRVTQNYLGSTSHLKHTTGNYKDYPIDCGGKDTGRDAIVCPCDEMIITAIRGYQDTKTTNTIWLASTSSVVTPTFTDKCFMTLTHANDDDIKDLKVGQKFKRGETICYEGKDGATANHIHIVVGRGTSNNWITSSTDALVMKGDTKKPEEVFFVDSNFTTILASNGLSFQILPDSEDVKEEMNEEIQEEKIEVAKEVDEETPSVETETEKSSSNKEIEEPHLIFEVKETKYYKIFLKENAKLYLKE